MIEANIRKKIEDLIVRAKARPLSSTGNARDTAEMVFCDRWITEALNICEVALPQPDTSYRRRIEALAGLSSGRMRAIHSIAEVFEALLPDIDAGLLGNLGNKIRAEVFDDFLDQAEWYAQQNRKMEAGVIAVLSLRILSGAFIATKSGTTKIRVLKT